MALTVDQLMHRLKQESGAGFGDQEVWFNDFGSLFEINFTEIDDDHDVILRESM